MRIYEVVQDTNSIIDDFVSYATKELRIHNAPKIIVKRDASYSAEKHTFGHFSPANNEILLQIQNRQILDVLRTLAHEMVHHKQNEDDLLHDESGATGSEHENEANAKAGVLMRNYVKTNPTLFERVPE